MANHRAAVPRRRYNEKITNPFPNGAFRYLSPEEQELFIMGDDDDGYRPEGLSAVQVEATRALPGHVQYTAGGLLATACERFVEDFPEPAGAGEQYRRELQQKQQRKWENNVYR